MSSVGLDDKATAIHEAGHAVAGALEDPPYLYRRVVLRALPPNTGFVFAHRARRREDLQDNQRNLLLTLTGPAASHRHDPDRSPYEDVSDYADAAELAERISAAEGVSSALVLAASEHQAFLLAQSRWDAIQSVGDAFLRGRVGTQWSLNSDQIREALVDAGLIPMPNV